MANSKKNFRSEDTKEVDIRKRIVEQYVKWRKSKRITQKQIADSMGVKRPNISRFESGKYNPSLDMLIRLANKMDLEMEIILKEKAM